jgi:hypothetical protein
MGSKDHQQKTTHEIEFLRERDPWTYAQTLEEYLRQNNREIRATSSNLQEHIESHYNSFKIIFDDFERGNRLPLSDLTVEQLISFSKAIRFVYNENIARFELVCTDDRIDHVQLTPQLAYALGFEENLKMRHGQMAYYAPDLRGAMSQLCVYMNHGVMESIIFGNSFSNLLQMVAVEGNSGETIQKLFTNPLMHRVVAREIDSMDFEIRSIDGRLVKFDYGQIILTLLFKKNLIF